MNKYINDFLMYSKNVLSYSDATIKAYRDDLLLFMHFAKGFLNLEIEVEDINIFILRSFKPNLIYSYLVYLNYYRDNTASTRQRRVEALRSFYKYMYKFYPSFREENNTMSSIEKVQQIFRLPKYFNLQQAKQLQGIFNKKNCRYPERNNAIIDVFLTTGVRISELVSLNINKIDFDNKLCRLIGKGNVERTIYFSSNCINKLQLYLNTRNDNNDALFLSNQSKRISVDAVEDICHKAYKLLGLSDCTGYSAHTLRHTSATIIYRSTRDILLTKEFLRP